MRQSFEALVDILGLFQSCCLPSEEIACWGRDCEFCDLLFPFAKTRRGA